MRRNLLRRIAVLWLAASMPAAEVAAAQCAQGSPTHHEAGTEVRQPGAATHRQHERHASTPSDDDRKDTAPNSPAVDCPMKVPCSTTAIRTSGAALTPARVKREVHDFGRAVIPLGIDHTSTTPPPRHTA